MVTPPRSNSPHALDEELDAELIRRRAATDNGHRTDLDEVITALGYDRAQLKAELDAHLAAEHAADDEDDEQECPRS